MNILKFLLAPLVIISWTGPVDNSLVTSYGVNINGTIEQVPPTQFVLAKSLDLSVPQNISVVSQNPYGQNSTTPQVLGIASCPDNVTGINIPALPNTCSKLAECNNNYKLLCQKYNAYVDEAKRGWRKYHQVKPYPFSTKKLICPL